MKKRILLFFITISFLSYSQMGSYNVFDGRYRISFPEELNSEADIGQYPNFDSDQLSFDHFMEQFSLRVNNEFKEYTIVNCYRLYKTKKNIKNLVQNVLNHVPFMKDTVIYLEANKGLKIELHKNLEKPKKEGEVQSFALFKNNDGIYDYITFHPNPKALENAGYWDSIQVAMLKSIELGGNSSRTESTIIYNTFNGDKILFKTNKKFAFEIHQQDSRNILRLSYLNSSQLSSLDIIVCSGKEQNQLKSPKHNYEFDFENGQIEQVNFLDKKCNLSLVELDEKIYFKLTLPNNDFQNLQLFGIVERKDELKRFKKLIRSAEVLE